MLSLGSQYFAGVVALVFIVIIDVSVFVIFPFNLLTKIIWLIYIFGSEGSACGYTLDVKRS